MKPSTEDRTAGKLHEVKGKIKEEVGKATNNPDLEVSGNAEKNAGKSHRRVRHRPIIMGSKMRRRISCHKP